MPETVAGYFTIERCIEGLTPRQMEGALGLPAGYFSAGCRIYVLLAQPRIGEFEQRGSSRYPDGKGLNRTQLTRTNFIPTAWLNQRLVKVKPRYDLCGLEFPASATPVEQWKLIDGVPAQPICVVEPDQKYYPNLQRKQGNA